MSAYSRAAIGAEEAYDVVEKRRQTAKKCFEWLTNVRRQNVFFQRTFAEQPQAKSGDEAFTGLTIDAQMVGRGRTLFHDNFRQRLQSDPPPENSDFYNRYSLVASEP